MDGVQTFFMGAGPDYYFLLLLKQTKKFGGVPKKFWGGVPTIIIFIFIYFLQKAAPDGADKQTDTRTWQLYD